MTYMLLSIGRVIDLRTKRYKSSHLEMKMMWPFKFKYMSQIMKYLFPRYNIAIV